MPDFSEAYLKSLLVKRLGSEEAFSPIIQRALSTAFKGHKGQFREAAQSGRGKIPYITHPVGVALIAIDFFDDADLRDDLDDVVATCIAHDVLEDTPVTLTELETQTNRRVAELVLSMTKPPVANSLSRAQRNEQFLQQIIDAGKTASFIKVCDAMHNISRPNQMPPYLLEKTIDKLDKHYRKLLAPFGESSKVACEFEQRLGAGIDQWRATQSTQQELDAGSLSEAVKLVKERARTKPLELHDVPDMVRQVCGVRYCEWVEIDTFLASSILPALRNRQTSASRIKQQILRQDKKKDGFALKELTQPISALPADGALLGYSVSGESGDERDKVLLIAIDDQKPRWLDADSFELIFDLMIEQYRFKSRERLSELVRETSRLGLSLDPSAAFNANLNYAALRSLKKRMSSGRFVLNSLEENLQQIFEDLEGRIPIVALESRLKSPDSMVRKLSRRKYNDFSEVDDLVGSRVVVLSSEHASKLVEILKTELSDPKSTLARALSVLPKSVQLRDVETRSGYRGRHIYFQAHTPASTIEAIPCEIQVRSVFEDAAAKLSHTVMYKPKYAKGGTKKLQEQLLKISDLVDQIEQIASEVD